MIEGGATPLHTPAELRTLGFQLVLHPVAPLYAAAHALEQLYAHLRSAGTTRAVLERLAPFGSFNALVDLDGVYEAEGRYAAGRR
jgi:2-methylisocitrate lyase-like PEP mutase family enzyme